MKKRIISLSLFVIGIIIILLISGCIEQQKKEQAKEPFIKIDRYSELPKDIVKGTPENDDFPPVLHSEEYEPPIPLTAINTAGAEDSPFIPADKDELYFVFINDIRNPPHIQIRRPVNGIWVSKFVNGEWQEPELIVLQEQGKLALNGCEFVQSNTLFFCSAREGYTGVHWFSAEYKDGEWINWKNVDFNPDYEIGELHIHNNELYYHSAKEGGKGGTDIWKLTKIDNEWVNPVNIEAVNTESDEGMPYLTPDGNELWFNRQYKGSPAIYRSKKLNGKWQKPELIISQFAGEPTLDKKGNIYFVHHYYKDGKMIESDIYVSYKK